MCHSEKSWRNRGTEEGAGEGKRDKWPVLLPRLSLPLLEQAFWPEALLISLTSTSLSL